MKTANNLHNLLLIICLFGQASAKNLIPKDVINKIKEKIEIVGETKATTKAAWTMLVYIAADNNLAPFASYNISDMATGLATTKGVNVLVQWDKPSDNKTWRYKITPGGKVDVGTLSTEMGYNPSKELLNSMQWAIKNYPSTNYALILWNHGSGCLDFAQGSRGLTHYSRWLNLLPASPERGILYDDSQNTCLTNQGLTSTLTKIKQLIGKNLDLLAMDACLMAMVEVAYQMKGLVNTFIASQQTIPGEGYPYSKFLNPLSLNAAGTTPIQLAQNMISSYKSYYSTQSPTPDFTLSAIDINSIDLIKQNIDQFITAVATCGKIDAATTKNIIKKARNAAISFEMPEYIDLYSFYSNILGQTKKSTPKSSLILQKFYKAITPIINNDYQNAVTTLNAVIQDGLAKINQTVLQKTAGPVYSGASGISIYYPSSGQIDPSYAQTIFAKNTAWAQFIQVFHY